MAESQTLKRQAAVKRSVIRNSLEARRRLLRRIARLSRTERRRVYLGSWSAREVVAHLIGWDHANVRAVAALVRSRLPDFYAHHDRDWQTYNALLVSRFGHGGTARLLKTAEASHRRLLRLLQSVPAEAFSEDRGLRFRGFKVTIRRIIEGEAADERLHLQQLSEEFGR